MFGKKIHIIASGAEFTSCGIRPPKGDPKKRRHACKECFFTLLREAEENFNEIMEMSRRLDEIRDLATPPTVLNGDEL